VISAGKRVALACIVALGMTQIPAACFLPPNTGALLDKCTAEARAAFYTHDASVEQAGFVFDACIADGGLDAR